MVYKKRDAAIRELEERLALNPRSRAFSRLADHYRAGGELRKAIDLCAAGLAAHPDYAAGRLVLGRCYAQQKDFESAVAELTKVCAADRRNHAAMKLLADIFVKQDRAEAAGRIYAILRDMEPDNGAVRQLSAKYRSALQGGICGILGIRADAEKLAQSLAASGINPFDNMQNLETIQSGHTGGYAPQTFGAPVAAPAEEPVMAVPAASELTGEDVGGQLDAIFGTEPSDGFMAGLDTGIITMPSTGEPTGEDIGNQLDAMFGTEPPPQPAAVPLASAPSVPPPGELSGEDVSDRLDAMFGTEPPQPAAVPLASASSVPPPGELSGEDVSDRLDAMFGTEPPPAAAPLASAPSAPPPGELSGEDVSDRIDAMFGTEPPPVAAPPAPALDAGSPTGEDIESMLDQMYGLQAPSMDMSAMGIDTGIITQASGELTGADIEDKLDAMYGTAAPAAAAPAPAAAAVIPARRTSDGGAAVVQPTGSDVVDQLDVMFGLQDAPAAPAPATADMVIDTGMITPAGADSDSRPSGSDVVDQLDVMFGLQDAPAAAADLSGVSGLAGGDLVMTPAAEAPEEEQERGQPASLFDFGSEETLRTDTSDLAEVITADGGIAGLFDFGAAAETMQFDAGAVASQMDDADLSDPFDFGAAMDTGIAELEPEIAEPSAPTLDDTASFKQNIPDPQAAEDGADTISFTSDEPAASLELVDGEDIESRLSELFGGDEPTGGADSDMTLVVDPDEIDGSPEDSVLRPSDGIEDTLEDITDDDLSDELSADGISELEDHLREILDEDIDVEISADIGNRTLDLSDALEDAPAAETPAPQYGVSEDDVQERIRQLFKAESPDAAEPIDVGADYGVDSVVDERDTPFDLPDHVLTPTLADIYFQQGQPKLALHIYERLTARDPDDERLAAQMQRVKDALLQTDETSGTRPAKSGGADKLGKAAALTGRKKKGAETKDDRRPLAGVRINKKNKPKRKP